MRSILNPFGSPAGLVDRFIGNSYDVVQYVARCMPDLVLLSQYLKKRQNYGTDFAHVKFVMISPADTAETVYTLDILNGDKPVGYKIYLLSLDGDVHINEALYTHSLQNNVLTFKFNDDVPDALFSGNLNVILDFEIV